MNEFCPVVFAVESHIIGDEKVMYRQDLINILTETQKTLNDGKLDLNRLDEMIFGIFRVVTDNDSLEKSPTGQDLLILIEKLSVESYKLVPPEP